MKRAAPLVLGLILPIACDDSPTRVESELPPETMLSSFVALSAGPNGTHPCPAGGEMARESDFDTVIEGNTFTATWSASIEHRACAIRIDQLVLTGDGTMSINGVERYEHDGNEIGGLLESTTHQTGTMRWRTNEGYDRTCDMDITVSRDPLTNVRRMTGSLCGNSVDLEFTIPQARG